jgi:hypothetical protein
MVGRAVTVPAGASRGRRVGYPVPPHLDAAIRNAVTSHPGAGLLDSLVRQSSAPGIGPLALVYMPAKFAGLFFRKQSRLLKIRDTPGYTWGTATYVAPVAFPTSSAIYGRVGVVARFDPTGWQVFDATTADANDLYLEWARYQPLFRQAMLTAQSAFYNQQLRNLFRTRYGIDCVLFRPDQLNLAYTRPAQDVWMAVTDWSPYGDIEDGYSSRFTDPKICVLADEEFEDDAGGTVRKALLGFTSTYVGTAALTGQVIAAYTGNTFVRIKA